MVRNEQILKDILLKMNYDSSKTLNENIEEQNIMMRPNTSPQQDRLSPSNIRPDLYRIQQNPEQHIRAMSLIYNGEIKPTKPYNCQDVIGTQAQRNSGIGWCLPYKSNRFLQFLKTTNGKKLCKGIGTPKPYCVGQYGLKELNKIYELDFENWRNNHPTPGLSKEAWHWILPIGAAAVTIMTGGVGGIIIAGVLEAADIALYIKEKDYESAGIGAAFAVIPGLMLTNKIPVVKKFTSGSLKTFINKIKQGLDLNPLEKELAKNIENNAKWLSTNANNFMKVSKLSSKILSKYTGRKLIGALLYMTKYGLIPWKFGWRITSLGGAFLTIVQIGKILGIQIQGIDYRNVQLPDNYVNLPKEKKNKIVNDIEKQVIDQSTNISESAKEVAEKSMNMLDEEKVSILAVELENLESLMDASFENL